jgi:hypothetical protein
MKINHPFVKHTSVSAVPLLATFAIIASLAVVSKSPAAVVFTFTSADNGVTATGNDGIKFTANADVIVDALGYYDYQRNGFQFSHSVGIYDAVTQILLTSVTVASSDLLISDFRYASIAPLTLEAGHSYIVVGHTTQSSIDQLAVPNDLVINSAVTYEGYVFNFDSTLTFPTLGLVGGRATFGPNLNMVAPEPSAAILTSGGLIGMILRKRREYDPHRRGPNER